MPKEQGATETVAALLARHRSGEVSATDTVERTFARIGEVKDPAIFIALRDYTSLRADAANLDARGNRNLPLYGVAVAVKDKIDVAGLPTTGGPIPTRSECHPPSAACS